MSIARTGSTDGCLGYAQRLAASWLCPFRPTAERTTAERLLGSLTAACATNGMAPAASGTVPGLFASRRSPAVLRLLPLQDAARAAASLMAKHGGSGLQRAAWSLRSLDDCLLSRRVPTGHALGRRVPRHGVNASPPPAPHLRQPELLQRRSASRPPACRWLSPPGAWLLTRQLRGGAAAVLPGFAVCQNACRCRCQRWSNLSFEAACAETTSPEVVERLSSLPWPGRLGRLRYADGARPPAPLLRLHEGDMTTAPVRPRCAMRRYDEGAWLTDSWRSRRPRAMGRWLSRPAARRKPAADRQCAGNCFDVREDAARSPGRAPAALRTPGATAGREALVAQCGSARPAWCVELMSR